MQNTMIVAELYMLEVLIDSDQTLSYTDPADYNISSMFYVEFSAGSTTSSVVIAIDDDVFEFSETFTLTITSTSDGEVLIGTNSQTTVNIEDDEMITVFFQEDPFSFLESDGEAVVTVNAELPSGGLAVNITLDVSFTDGTAISEWDSGHNNSIR